jgi:hypothetical protein
MFMPPGMNMADGTFEQQKTVSVQWEESGSVDGVRVTNRREADGL